MPKTTKETPRPALALLDQLNSKLQVDNEVLKCQRENAALKAENNKLVAQQAKLEKELEIERRLRKVWNK